jgi:NitT/TauT family transport system ATP-binding protein
MAPQTVKMVNTELPDILELKEVCQTYTDPDGTKHQVIASLNLLIEDLPGKGEFVVILGSSGCGKCVAKGTWVVTSDGIRRIEDLFNNEECIDDTITKLPKNSNLNVIVNGKLEKITHKYYGGIKKTIKITTDNGVFIEGTHEHPVLVFRDNKESWQKLCNVKESDYLIQEINQEQFFSSCSNRTLLPRAVPKSYYSLINRVSKYKKMGLNNNEISKLTDASPMTICRYVNNKTGKIINPTFKAPLFMSGDMAYYFGLLSGDGDISGYTSLCTMDSEIKDFFIGYTKNSLGTTVSISKKSGTEALSLRPLSNPFYKNWISKIFNGSCNADTKDVPRAIRLASFKHQLAFLQVLMDTDGHSDIKNKRAEISLNSEKLIDFVCSMLSALGITYTRSKRKKSFRVSTRQSHNIYKLFRLSRKIQEPNEELEQEKRIYLKISSITQGESEVYDLTNPKSHSFVANSLVVHNSHILRYLSGLQTPTSGEVLISGRPRKDTDFVGMVFQAYSSFEYFTVLENVAMGLEFRGVPKKERETKAMEMIDKVGLKGHEHKFAKYPNLSGGQLQRVAIARSLAYDSRILLMDEPFGALDIETRGKMQDLLAEIWVSITPTIIMVTHAIDEAVYLGDRIYVMGGSPSNIIKEFVSPLPLVRNRKMKREPAFIHMVQEIEDFMMSL